MALKRLFGSFSKPKKLLKQVHVNNPRGMLTWSFLSSFLGLNKQLRSYLIPKKLLKKVHVNIPLA